MFRPLYSPNLGDAGSCLYPQPPHLWGISLSKFFYMVRWTSPPLEGLGEARTVVQPLNPLAWVAQSRLHSPIWCGGHPLLRRGLGRLDQLFNPSIPSLGWHNLVPILLYGVADIPSFGGAWGGSSCRSYPCGPLTQGFGMDG